MNHGKPRFCRKTAEKMRKTVATSESFFSRDAGMDRLNRLTLELAEEYEKEVEVSE